MNRQLDDKEDIEKMIASGNIVTNDDLQHWLEFNLEFNNATYDYGELYNKGCFNIPSCSMYDKDVLSFEITHDIKYDNNNNEYISKNIAVMQQFKKIKNKRVVDDMKKGYHNIALIEIARGSVDNLGNLLNLELEENKIRAIKEKYFEQGYLDIDKDSIQRTWFREPDYFSGQILKFRDFSTDNLDIDLELIKLEDEKIYAFYDYAIGNLPDMFKGLKYINQNINNPIEEIRNVPGAIASINHAIYEDFETSFSRNVFSLSALKEKIEDIMINTDSLYEKALDDFKTYGIPKKTNLILNEYVKEEERIIMSKNKIIDVNPWNTKFFENPWKTKEDNDIDYER